MDPWIHIIPKRRPQKFFWRYSLLIVLFLDFPSVNTKGAVAKQGMARRLICKKGGRLARLASLVSLGAALKVGGHLTCKKGGASWDSLRSFMLCYVMLCNAMLCYGVPPLVLPQPPSCYVNVMLCYGMLCHAMLCYVVLRYVTQCYVMLCYVAL